MPVGNGHCPSWSRAARVLFTVCLMAAVWSGTAGGASPAGDPLGQVTRSSGPTVAAVAHATEPITQTAATITQNAATPSGHAPPAPANKRSASRPAPPRSTPPLPSVAKPVGKAPGAPVGATPHPARAVPPTVQSAGTPISHAGG